MKNGLKILYPKAGLIVCLFCLVRVSPTPAQQAADNLILRAHRQILSLELNEARKALENDHRPEAFRLMSLAGTIDLLLTGNESRLPGALEQYENAINALKQQDGPEALFALADIRLQMAMVYLRFDQPFAASWNVRQSYVTVRACRQKLPSYSPLMKTSGVLEVMLGSIPDKYQWLLNLLDMRASVDRGMSELGALAKVQSPLGTESRLLYDLIQSFVLQETNAPCKDLTTMIRVDPANLLLLLVGASLAIKNNQSETALAHLGQLENLHTESIPYVHYLKGEARLHKGDYPGAIASYTTFLETYAGKGHRKDALYKTGLCYWLSGDSTRSNAYFTKAGIAGSAGTEADDYADAQLNTNPYCNVKLTRVRFFTDGGYYKEAANALAGIVPEDLLDKKDQVEYYYRKARLAHKQLQLPSARLFYKQVIAMAGEGPWYFAPNACLQMGYLERDDGHLPEARAYFERVLNYRRYEYKTSIQSKARSALNELQP